MFVSLFSYCFRFYRGTTLFFFSTLLEREQRLVHGYDIVWLVALFLLIAQIVLPTTMANKKLVSKYKAAHSLEIRKAEAEKVRERHPDRLPVICEKVESSPINDLDKNKFLVPADLTVGQFVLVVRKRVILDAQQAIFLFINDTVPPTSAHMSDLYEKHKDEDGFLYVKYAGENVYGAL